MMTETNWPASTPKIRDPRHRYAEVVGTDSLVEPSKVRRWQWVQQTAPEFEFGFQFFGGLTASRMFEEVQNAYIQGFYGLVIIGGMSVIEQELAGILRTIGENIEKISAYQAIESAKEHRLISKSDAERLQSVRKFRNTVLHFRSGTEEDSPEAYAIDTGIPIRVLEKRNARKAMIGMFLVSEFWGVGQKYSNTSPPPGTQKSLSAFVPSNPADPCSSDVEQKEITKYIPLRLIKYLVHAALSNK